jgi:hypothetical protein
MKAPNTHQRGDAPILSSEEIANMFGFLIAAIAYVGWTGSPSRQLPSQRATRPTRDRLEPVQGITPRQEPSTYG